LKEQSAKMTYMKRGFEARWNEAKVEAEARARFSGLEDETLTRT